MSLYPILAVGVVMLASHGMSLSAWGDAAGPGFSWALAWGPVAALLVATWIAMRACLARATRERSARWVLAAERLGAAATWAAMANHVVATLVFGWLDGARAALGGDLWMADEILASLPPLLAAAGVWWAYYPIQRQVRSATLLRRLDRGEAVYALPTRAEYVWRQVRVQILLLYVPILLIVAIGETVDRVLPPAPPGEFPVLNEALTLAGALLVFTLAPLLARVLLEVESMPPGEVRSDLLAIGAAHGVKVRDVLLWKTGGGMINGAVMGLLAPLRYVLLTDALLDSMTRRQVIAVMAHEIGHVKRHHMPWMVLALTAILLVLGGAADAAIEWILRRRPAWYDHAGTWIETLGLVAVLAPGLVAFGWVSRRFERQADTFAVQHLSGLGRTRPDPGDAPAPEPRPGRIDDAPDAPRLPPGRIPPDAADAMREALEVVTRLNHVNPRQRSWRHGSIRWRQRYLRDIVGKPVDRLPIDRTVRRLKLAAAALFAAGLLLSFRPRENPAVQPRPLPPVVDWDDVV